MIGCIFYPIKVHSVRVKRGFNVQLFSMISDKKKKFNFSL